MEKIHRLQVLQVNYSYMYMYIQHALICEEDASQLYFMFAKKDLIVQIAPGNQKQLQCCCTR